MPHFEFERLEANLASGKIRTDDPDRARRNYAQQKLAGCGYKSDLHRPLASGYAREIQAMMTLGQLPPRPLGMPPQPARPTTFHSVTLQMEMQVPDRAPILAVPMGSAPGGHPPPGLAPPMLAALPHFPVSTPMGGVEGSMGVLGGSALGGGGDDYDPFAATRPPLSGLPMPGMPGMMPPTGSGGAMGNARLGYNTLAEEGAGGVTTKAERRAASFREILPAGGFRA